MPLDPFVPLDPIEPKDETVKPLDPYVPLDPFLPLEPIEPPKDETVKPLDPYVPLDPFLPLDPVAPLDPFVPLDPYLPLEKREYTAQLTVGERFVQGDVICHGQSLTETTQFKVKEGESFDCEFGQVNLAHFTAPFLFQPKTGSVEDALLSFEVTAKAGPNAAGVLNSINQCKGETELCLDEMNSFDIAAIYQQLDDQSAVDDFLTVKDDELTEEVGNAPSSHVDSDLKPVTSGGRTI